MENEADMGPFADMDPDLIRAISTYGTPPFRQIVTETVRDFGNYQFDELPQDIPGWIELLANAQGEIPVEFAATAKCVLNYETGYYDSGDSASLRITYERPETDEEMTERVGRGIAYVRNREHEKRRQYEALKREFEQPSRS